MEKIKLYEEYKLIEKTEAEVNGAWKGAHLLLFFMAFVFGSFCTFCFHMMMYLFDEKCVLFPKLLSLTSLRHNLIYEFIPDEKMAEKIDHLKSLGEERSGDSSTSLPSSERSSAYTLLLGGKITVLPVDFLSTQWIDKSACYLPTYVPLVSGIFGLVWTTMFLMCSASSRTLTGLQRPWRVLPPVFVFSILMGSLCIYSSAVTHYGLQELCLKLGEITGSTTCTYTVNVATLAYERRIRGVYQATQLTIASAWLHTACWLLSALLALVRVFLAVDFHLVRVTAHLQGDIDRMLERYEKHVRTVTPDLNIKEYNLSYSVTRVHFKQPFNSLSLDGDSLYISHKPLYKSEISLVPEEKEKLMRLSVFEALPEDERFVLKLLYDILDSINPSNQLATSSTVSNETDSSNSLIVRQFGQERIRSIAQEESLESPDRSREYLSIDLHGDDEIYTEIKDHLFKSFEEVLENPEKYESVMNITSEMKLFLEREHASPSQRADEEKVLLEPAVREETDADSNIDKKLDHKSRKKEKQD